MDHTHNNNKKNRTFFRGLVCSNSTASPIKDLVSIKGRVLPTGVTAASIALSAALICLIRFIDCTELIISQLNPTDCIVCLLGSLQSRAL